MMRQKLLLIALFLFSNSTFALDCVYPQTQADMNQCAFAELERETKIINKTYHEFIARLNPLQKQQFKKIQLAWIKYKDLLCKFEASGVAGGSAYSMVLAGCLAEKTRQRNKEIEALNSCQEGDLSCPSW